MKYELVQFGKKHSTISSIIIVGFCCFFFYCAVISMATAKRINKEAVEKGVTTEELIEGGSLSTMEKVSLSFCGFSMLAGGAGIVLALVLLVSNRIKTYCRDHSINYEKPKPKRNITSLEETMEQM